MLIRIEEEQDIEVLRQVALQLDRENQRLIERIQLLTREISKLHGAEAQKAQTELEFLRELLARRERALFAESSEKRPGNGGETEPKPPASRRGHGPRPQPDLPLREEVHDLPEKDQACPVCGGQLQEMKDQFEEYEEITVVERQFVLTKHRRKKYRCRCNACIVTAPGSLRLQPGSRYSPEFAVEVAAGKFLDHEPLERQCRIMERQGLRIDSQTLWDQTHALYWHLVPSYEAIGRYILESDLVHVDETHWRLMNKEGSSRWYVWGIQGEDAVFYKILKNRSMESAREILQGFTGVAVADRYSAYTALVRDGPGRFQLAHCWAHVRRKYFEIQNNYPAQCKEILDLIGDLYKAEHLASDFEGSREDRLRLVAELRSERSVPIVEQIHAWALGQTALPQSGMGRAIAYMINSWAGLTLFLKDARIPLDNNAIERALRGVVLGRKNHYGSRSQRGARVAALYYTLFESAKLAGVEPRSYVLRAALAAIEKPGTITLPCDLAR